MIFDDYDNFSGNQVTLTPNSKMDREAVTSLDNFIVNKEQKIKKSSFLHFYDLYQIHINKNAFTDRDALKRSRKLPNLQGSIFDSAHRKKKTRNVNLLILTAGKGKSLSDESIENFNEDFSVQEVRGSIGYSTRKIFDKNERVDAHSRHSRDSLQSIENEVSIQDNSPKRGPRSASKDKNQAFRSYNMLKRFSDKLQKRRSKSSDNINDTEIDDQESVHLESFVSLDGLARKQKSIRAEEEICHICMKEYVLKDYIAKMVVCNHIFHKDCIDEHIKQVEYEDIACPLCHNTQN